MIDAGEHEGLLFASTPSPRSENGNVALGCQAAQRPYAHQFTQPFGQGDKFVDEFHPNCPRWCKSGQSCSQSHCRHCHHPHHAPAVELSAKNDRLRKDLKITRREREEALRNNAKLENSLSEQTIKDNAALDWEEKLQQDSHKRQREHERLEAEHDDVVQQLKLRDAELQTCLKSIQHAEAELQRKCANDEILENQVMGFKIKETEALQREEHLQEDLQKMHVEHGRMTAEHDDVVQQLKLRDAELQTCLKSIQHAEAESQRKCADDEILENQVMGFKIKETEALQREEHLQEDLQKMHVEHGRMTAEHDDVVQQLKRACAEKDQATTELRHELLKMQGVMQVASSSELSLSEAKQACLQHAQQNYEMQAAHARCVVVEKNLHEELKRKNESLRLSEAHVTGLQYLRETDAIRFSESQAQLDKNSLHTRSQDARLLARNVFVSCLNGIASWTCQQVGRPHRPHTINEFHSSSAQDVHLRPAPIETADLWNLTERSIEKAVNDLGDDILQIAAGKATKGESGIFGLPVSELPHWQPWMDFGAAKKICSNCHGPRYIAENCHLRLISDRFTRMRLQPRAEVFYEEREFQHPWGGIAVMPADTTGTRSIDCGFFRAEVFPGGDFDAYEWELFMSWSPDDYYWAATATTTNIGDADSSAGHTWLATFSNRALLNSFTSHGADLAAGPINQWNF